MTEIIEHFDIFADEIEVGDQIILEGELLTVVRKDDTDDPDEVLITADSFESGDRDTYPLLHTDRVTVWSI